MHGEHYWGDKITSQSGDLLKLANAKHGDCVTISKGPESINCSCLSNLHVYTWRVCCCRDWPTFPGGKNTELLYGHHRLQITVSKMILPSNLWRPNIPETYQFVHLGVAASKSVLVSTPCHLKIPLFWVVFPFSPIAYLLIIRNWYSRNRQNAQPTKKSISIHEKKHFE